MSQMKWPAVLLYFLAGTLLAQVKEFQGHVDYATGNSPSALAVADFDNDGELDLAVANLKGDTVSILRGNGDGSFRQRVDYVTGEGPDSVGIGDFNADGKADIVVVNSTELTVSVLLGNGDSTFQPRVDYARGAGIFACCNLVAVADFNGDGNLDLVVANYGPDFQVGTVSILLGNGDGSFLPQTQYPAGVNPVGIMIGDFNKDDKTDLAVLNNNPPFGISVLLGNGDGSFQKPVLHVAGSNSRVGVVADFNSDGNLDLGVANWLDNNVSILLGDGDGSFMPQIDFRVGANPNALAGADLKGDGTLDLVTANQSSNNVSVLLGKGDGTFARHADYTTGAVPSSVIVADFNKDGAPDVVSANASDNTVSMLLNRGGTFVKTTSSSNPSNLGEAVTFITAVTASLQGVGTPTGTVTFSDGALTLGTLMLQTGQATFTISRLNVGIHKIRAKYSGDATFNSHQAIPITQKVQP